MELSEQNAQLALKQLARKMGAKNSTVLLDRLGKNKQFINAIESPTGREIISLVVETIQNGVDKLMEPGKSQEQWNELYKDYLELQATLKFHSKVLGIFKVYDKDREKFNEVMGD